MSKNHNNVNPDHYKTEGREPQGQAVAHEVERQQYAETLAREKRQGEHNHAKNAVPVPSEEGEGTRVRPAVESVEESVEESKGSAEKP